LESNELIERISDLIFSKKGADVKILDLRELTTIADYFIICSADSDVQVKAIADEIDKQLHNEGIRLWHKEGYKGLNWVLLDYVDVVVHVFKKSVREFYNLERLWGDAPVIEAVDKAEVKTAVKKTRTRKKQE
jgi:ribosome-associated protein